MWLGFERKDLRAWFRAAGLVNIIVDGTGETCSSKSQSCVGEGMADISIFVATGSRRVSGAQGRGAGELRRAGGQRAAGGCQRVLRLDHIAD